MQAAYLAGLFDGDGSVTIRRQKPRHNTLVTYSISCTINLTCAKTIQAVRDHLGFGSLFTIKRSYGHIKPVHRWTAASRQAEQFLTMIEPYSITKKPEIKLALRFQRHMHKYHYSNNGYAGQKGFHHHPDHVRNTRQAMYLRMQELKRIPSHL